jgi:hypothetical protein
LTLTNIRVSGGLLLGGARVPNVNLSGSTVGGAVRLDAVEFENTFDLNGATVEGPVEIHVTRTQPIHVRAIAAHLNGGLNIEAPDIGSLALSRAEVRKNLTLRGRCQTHGDFVFYGASLPALIDLRDCKVSGELSFSGVAFDPRAKLNLSNATLYGNLVLAGTHYLPGEINLNRTGISGDTTIRAELGSPTPRLVAKEINPRFEGAAEFVNVDLTECLLVGNPFQRLEFSRVVWPQWYGRRVLLDELSLRSGRRFIPLESLREAYQLLKKKSGDAGDHALAGDFHYGELEMRRHERGPFRSLLCWEFLYWFVSGYGTRPAPAFGWLCLLTILGALLYWWSAAPDKGFLDALRFSVAVTTLQKREDTGEVGGWVRVVQTILGAVLIALFVLAVRMRLKR